IGIVLAFWSVFSVVSAFYSAVHLRVDVAVFIHYRKVDASLLGSAIKAACPAFASAISVRTVLSLDKFLLEKIGGIELVGIYTFFLSVINSVLAVLDAGYISKVYRSVTQMGVAGDLRGVLGVCVHTFVCGALLSSGSFTICMLFFSYQGMESHLEHVGAFIILSLFVVVIGIGNVLRLYELSADKQKVVLSAGIYSLISAIIVYFLLRTVDPMVRVSSVIFVSQLIFLVILLSGVFK